MPKIVLQFTEDLSPSQQKHHTNELSQLCKLLSVEFELYGKFDDFDIFLPEDMYDSLNILNVLQSYAALKRIAVRVVS